MTTVSIAAGTATEVLTDDDSPGSIDCFYT